MKSAHEYQRKADECRQRATHAVHPDDKAGWLQAAQDWDSLALCVGQSAEERGLGRNADFNGPVQMNGSMQVLALDPARRG